ncbi:MAG: hypothetical protein WCO23_02090 [bacterium]
MKKNSNSILKFCKKINLSNEVLRRILAAFSYLLILIIIPALFMRKNTYIAFHVRQGFLLLCLEALTVISFYIALLPALLLLLSIVLTIIGIVSASLGRRNALPLIGKLAA